MGNAVPDGVLFSLQIPLFVIASRSAGRRRGKQRSKLRGDTECDTTIRLADQRVESRRDNLAVERVLIKFDVERLLTKTGGRVRKTRSQVAQAVIGHAGQQSPC